MEIVSGYNRKCKNNIGGVKSVWLVTWKPYNRSQIVTNNNKLISFPESIAYKFESVTNVTAEEKINENDGGKYYEQNLSMSFKSNLSRDFDKLLNKDFRVLILDNNGYYRIFGLYKGLECKKIDFKSGGAKSELNGYSFSLEGIEEKESFFVDDPFNIGFIENNG